MEADVLYQWELKSLAEGRVRREGLGGEKVKEKEMKQRVFSSKYFFNLICPDTFTYFTTL